MGYNVKEAKIFKMQYLPCISTGNVLVVTKIIITVSCSEDARKQTFNISIGKERYSCGRNCTQAKTYIVVIPII